MKLKYLIWVLLCLVQYQINAQNTDRPDLNPNLKGGIPTTPNATALGMYGSAPVSLHTGHLPYQFLY